MPDVELVDVLMLIKVHTKRLPEFKKLW